MRPTSTNILPAFDQRAAAWPERTGLATTLTLAAMSLGYGVVQPDVTMESN
ncbi:hypothetical protein [Bradyrhizobium jicamae]|uniref:hypothetical protein n=1 Tax=Bradyrhizobium jicamae TaxID=280332 RepID=UPI001BA62CE4|nr:hypothetical protein [Bradyrhizobium jicamae]MBR0938566.1 hypothetical protein [Bradyrhizobium jicamae]